MKPTAMAWIPSDGTDYAILEDDTGAWAIPIHGWVAYPHTWTRNDEPFVAIITAVMALLDDEGLTDISDMRNLISFQQARSAHEALARFEARRAHEEQTN